MSAARTMASAEIADRARELYDRRLKSRVEAGNIGRYIVIDIGSEDFEIGDDFLAPTKAVRSRHPEGLLHTIRIGYPVAGRIGAKATLDQRN